MSSGLWDTAVKPKTHRITKQITAKGHQNAAATWHLSQCCVNDPAVVDKASASLVQNEPTEHAAPFSWLCNFARIHQSLSHCLGILITQQRMQFGDYYFVLAHAQLNLPTHAVTICHKSVASLPAHRNPLTAAGLTLNHNKRADWNLCHVSCTIKVAMAPHAGGP